MGQWHRGGLRCRRAAAASSSMSAPTRRFTRHSKQTSAGSTRSSASGLNSTSGRARPLHLYGSCSASHAGQQHGFATGPRSASAAGSVTAGAFAFFAVFVVRFGGAPVMYARSQCGAARIPVPSSSARDLSQMRSRARVSWAHLLPPPREVASNERSQSPSVPQDACAYRCPVSRLPHYPTLRMWLRVPFSLRLQISVRVVADGAEVLVREDRALRRKRLREHFAR